MEAFFAWIQTNKPKVTPKSLLGKALSYALNQKSSKLLTFLEDGQLEIDNNRSERSIKPFVIGRKNWLFSATSKGARSSALIYSVMETAKENLCILSGTSRIV
ncbi:IS66 family transposase [Salipaludibacillus sp. CF4.18]|uniref:IS66 family transposase n=1 Tax=Salipaludibacillus sp. CF4.18 TaxID=3373081 RepID=UPI003EE7A609